MSDNKKWTRADARAEMNRVLEGTRAARKTLFEAYTRVGVLGCSALNAAMQGVALFTHVKHISIGITITG